MRRISRALGVPLEILLDSTPVLCDQDSAEGMSEGAPISHVMMGGLERSFSSDRAEELTEKFRMLLASPLADGIARIVEESFRLLPIIPPPSAVKRIEQPLRAGSRRRHAPSGPWPSAVDDGVKLTTSKRSVLSAQCPGASGLVHLMQSEFESFGCRRAAGQGLPSAALLPLSKPGWR